LIGRSLIRRSRTGPIRVAHNHTRTHTHTHRHRRRHRAESNRSPCTDAAIYTWRAIPDHGRAHGGNSDDRDRSGSLDAEHLVGSGHLLGIGHLARVGVIECHWRHHHGSGHDSGTVVKRQGRRVHGLRWMRRGKQPVCRERGLRGRQGGCGRWLWEARARHRGEATVLVGIFGHGRRCVSREKVCSTRSVRRLGTPASSTTRLETLVKAKYVGLGASVTS
jgi:hypothetical protein